jgi:hypothetical protein
MSFVYHLTGSGSLIVYSTSTSVAGYGDVDAAFSGVTKLGVSHFTQSGAILLASSLILLHPIP